jgi:hypothetical protein
LQRRPPRYMWSRLSADHHHRRCPLDWKKQANSERPRALIKSNPHYALPLPPISPINSPSNEHGKDSRIYSANVSESCTAVTPKASWRTPFPQRIINVCRRYQRSSVSQTQVALRAVLLQPYGSSNRKVVSYLLPFMHFSPTKVI